MTARTLTHSQFTDEAIARFGNNPSNWKFVCPACGDVASGLQFIAALGSRDLALGRMGQECIGRSLGALTLGKAEKGCDYAAYGLIPGPVTVTFDKGRAIRVFEFAGAAQ